MKLYKTIIASAFVLGVILTVFIYQAVTVYQLRSQTEVDHATLTQVVNFLNSQLQAAQQKPVVQTSQVPQSVPQVQVKK